MQSRNHQSHAVTAAMSTINIEGKRKRWEEQQKRLREQGSGKDAVSRSAVILQEVNDRADKLQEESETSSAAAALTGISEEAQRIIGEWQGEEVDVQLEEEDEHEIDEEDVWDGIDVFFAPKVLQLLQESVAATG